MHRSLAQPSPAALGLVPRRHADDAVDIGVSTHAHFDHDALNRLDAHVLLDRLIGTYRFLDVTITGIPDKHATASGFGSYDFKMVHRELHGVDIEPPDNPRSWDNCLVVVETGGLRILHWGDNRHDPPEHVWEALGRIDIALLPVDGSQHVMSFEMTAVDHRPPAAESCRAAPLLYLGRHDARLDAAAGRWVGRGPAALPQDRGTRGAISATDLAGQETTADFFGGHVAFDKLAWRNGELA